MKGIILTAGKGTRLYPVCRVINKQFVLIYDKPLIYYSLALLMQAEIRDILIISSERDLESFQAFLGDGSQLGISIRYDVQKVQRGIADAFLIGEEFIGDDSVCLVLGDNIFWSNDFAEKLLACTKLEKGAYVFGLPSECPSQFGVVEFDANGNVLSIEEKPEHPKSNYIVPGLYFYDNRVVSIAKTVEPSARGELEITSVNNAYLKEKQLKVMPLSEDALWFDAGTPDRVLAASNAIKETQQREGIVIGCVEEIAYQKGYIGKDQLCRLGEPIAKADYGKYVMSLCNNAE
jgi:glucose-1-phosphate thymidylyltransferase